ncbi:MAG: type II secretion system protein F [Proteobacteria bacterium]|nr:type II secretion system protein F [Pseudomonadota bacterium]
MTPGLLHILLLVSLALFMGLGWAGLLIASAQQRQTRFAARVAGLMETDRVVIAPDPLPIARAASPREVSRLARILMVFGCDYDRREIYPVSWWAVILAGCIAGRIAVALSGSMLGALSYLLWPIVSVLVSRSAFSHWEGKQRDVLLKQFPDALGMVVRGVRVGVPVTEAIRIVAREAPDPTGPEFARLADAIAIGTPLDAALRDSAARTKLPEYRFFATALTLQAQAGGTLSESLDMLADVIRRRVALKARGYALTSEGRTSTLVLCAMPFLIAGMLFVLNPPYLMVMFNEAAGRKMMTVGIMMLLTGIFIMRKMIRSTLA